jgi:peptidoglycan hydrolase-like protein with peptidoglycan-binding domain
VFDIVEGPRRRVLLFALSLWLATALTVGAPRASAQSSDVAAVASSPVLASGAGFDGRLQAHVRQLQRQLGRLGYRPGPIDGFFGPLTAGAVRRLQAANGVAIDGVVGPVTRRALHSQAGASASRVRRAQRQLRVLGRRPGPVDGIFGPRTVRALRRFQDAAGINGVARLSDAMVARLTRAARDARPQERVKSKPAPSETNEAPSATTQTPPATQTPQATTQTPSTTQVPPATTQVPPATAQAPQAPSTTQAPPATTRVPPATTEAPSATGEIPPATSEIPPATGAVAPATTEIPPATSEIPPATTEIPPATTEIPPATTEVPPAAGQPPSTTAQTPSAAIPAPGVTTPPAAPTTGQTTRTTPTPDTPGGPEIGSIVLVVLASAAGALLLGWGTGRRRRHEVPFRSKAKSALVGLLSLVAVAAVLVPLLSGIDAVCGTGCDPAPQPVQLAYDAAMAVTLALTAALLAVWLLGRRRSRRAGTPEAGERPPLLVIVIPARNLEMVIGETVRHVLAQPYRPLIAMVVNDGSTDGTGDMARSAAAMDPRVVVVDRPGDGRAAALDYAYRVLVGARSSTTGAAKPADIVVGVLDAGLWLAPDALAAVAPCFADPAVGAVQLPVRADNARDGFLPRMQDIDAVAHGAFVQQARDLAGSADLAASGHFVRLTALRTLGNAPWTRAAAGDGDLAGELVARGWEVRFCGTSCVSGPALPYAGELLRRRGRRMQERHARWSDLSALRRGGRLSLARRVERALQPFAPLAVGAALGYTALSLAGLAGALRIRQTLVEAVGPSGALDGVVAVALACGPLALLAGLVLASATAYGGRAAPPTPLWAAPGLLLAHAAYTCWWGLPAIARTLAGTGKRDAAGTRPEPADEAAPKPADQRAGEPLPEADGDRAARRAGKFGRTAGEDKEVAHR